MLENCTTEIPGKVGDKQMGSGGASSKILSPPSANYWASCLARTHPDRDHPLSSPLQLHQRRRHGDPCLGEGKGEGGQEPSSLPALPWLEHPPVLRSRPWPLCSYLYRGSAYPSFARPPRRSRYNATWPLPQPTKSVRHSTSGLRLPDPRFSLRIVRWLVLNKTTNAPV